MFLNCSWTYVTQTSPKGRVTIKLVVSKHHTNWVFTDFKTELLLGKHYELIVHEEKKPKKKKEKEHHTPPRTYIPEINANRNLSGVGKHRFLHDLHHAWKQGQSTKLCKIIAPTPPLLSFWGRECQSPSQISDKRNQQEHLILRFLTHPEIQLFSSSTKD